MKDYQEVLHEHIMSLFDQAEIKIDIKVITDRHGNLNHDESVGIRATHLATGEKVVCDLYDSQVKNANIALLVLKKTIDDVKKVHRLG